MDLPAKSLEKGDERLIVVFGLDLGVFESGQQRAHAVLSVVLAQLHSERDAVSRSQILTFEHFVAAVSVEDLVKIVQLYLEKKIFRKFFSKYNCMH